MSDRSFDVIVIGGGIVGLSTAVQLLGLRPDIRLLVLEKEDAVAKHQSGHNSGVIHSGVYYKPGSLKAKMCVEGAAAMVEFCREHNLPLQICGKVIVATTDEEMPRLQVLFERGQSNGVPGLRLLTCEQVREIEPHCASLRGLHVPGTGITDYAEVCRKYAAIIQARGGSVLTSSGVINIAQRSAELALETKRGEFLTRYAVNCAGLQSDRISRMAGRRPDVKIVPFRGEYYDLIPERENLVKGLIYPVPDPQFPFLGVHLTRRARGGVDAGPNAVLALKREGYGRMDFSLRDFTDTLAFPGFWRMAGRYWRQGTDEFRRSFSKQLFVNALQRLVPELTANDLVADGSGVRAQALRPDGYLVDDFQFVQTQHMLHVWNVPSPAATASIPIGRTLAGLVIQGLN
ncbi:MAG: L-2-hydroxyglutarate oxidase [Acidobacteria bacterium]|nr:MAG: L-2-hydroxyglutarate oxidase [Acidobacteriota bacterium]PYV91336.1 MAG: L-2-hydroxyglutarate oxidase [Acidobacteriota bacterium]